MALSILDRLNADGEIGAPSVFQNVIAAGPLAPANSHPARDIVRSAAPHFRQALISPLISIEKPRSGAGFRSKYNGLGDLSGCRFGLAGGAPSYSINQTAKFTNDAAHAATGPFNNFA